MQLPQLGLAPFENVLMFLKPNRVVAVMQASKKTNDRSWNIWRAKGPMTTVMRNVICSVFHETKCRGIPSFHSLRDDLGHEPTLGDIFKRCESKHSANLRRKLDEDVLSHELNVCNRIDLQTTCVASIYAVTTLMKQLLPHSSTKDVFNCLRNIVDGDNFDEEISTLNIFCIQMVPLLSSINLFTIVVELQMGFLASCILSALCDGEDASKSQNVQNETEDKISFTSPGSLAGEEIGQPPGKEQEQADADEQEALNQSEADAIELDQTHMQTALRESEAPFIEQEQQDVTEALMRSKADLPAVKYEILRLSTCSGDVTHMLLHSDELAYCRNRVADAGAEFALLPEWANGALLLVPVTSQEIADAGIDLRAHHIVAKREDVENINTALATIPRRQKRPKLKDTRPSSSAAASDGSNRDLADATQSALDEGLGFVKVIVENTFVKAYTVHGDSESSSTVPSHRTV